MADGTLSGGMLPKIASALDAARNGVKSEVHHRRPRRHCLLLEILTDHGVGTMIKEQVSPFVPSFAGNSGAAQGSLSLRSPDNFTSLSMPSRFAPPSRLTPFSPSAPFYWRLGFTSSTCRASSPCPMCIMQRYALAVCGRSACSPACTTPDAPARTRTAPCSPWRPSREAAWRRASRGSNGIRPRCRNTRSGPEYMLDSFPLTSALLMIFRGAGDCSVVDWTFLGLSIANWSFVSFAAILLPRAHAVLTARQSQRLKRAQHGGQ